MSLIDVDPKTFPSFAGSIALITGGGSGIGLATTELLLSLSCKVLVSDLNPPPASLLAKNGSSVHFHKTDVANYQSLFSAFKACFTAFGQYPDIVFANAGIAEKGVIIENATDADVEIEPKHDVLNIDLYAVANTVRIAWWGMKKRGGGNIVMTASLAGYFGMNGLSLYCPAKSGVVGLVRALRYTAPADKIAISLVAPAITSTPILGDAVNSYETTVKKLRADGVPLNTPQRIAEAVVWMLAKKQAANGMGIAVQGGLVTDFEKNLAANRKVWMGEKMAELYKGGAGKSGNFFLDKQVEKVEKL